MASTFFGNDWDYKYNFIDGQHVRNLYLCLTIESEGHNSVLNDMTYRPPGSQQTFFFINIRLPSNIISSISYLFTKQTEQNRQSIALNLWTKQPAGTQVHGQSPTSWLLVTERNNAIFPWLLIYFYNWTRGMRGTCSMQHRILGEQTGRITVSQTPVDGQKGVFGGG